MKHIFIVSLALLSLCAVAQQKPNNEVSLDALTTETQFSSDSPDLVEFIWWIPNEFWEASFSQDPSISASEAQEIVSLVEDYTIVIALKGKIGVFGGINYEDVDHIQKEFTVTYNGTDLRLIGEKELNADTRNFISMMKPMISNMLGPMGENMNFFIYDNKKSPINVFEEGYIQFTLGDYETGTELPLGSLLQEKQCSVTKKLHNGKWSYCPYHGVPLTNK
ncbi:hypothetical protein Q2T40_16720 [Winogradskyella maritima]|uniref:Uncharacterized protein n=1 Tax=Winogradskyella maritima TaxID=1517766 RepID=A0ABV8AET3_9FLAO|nr:hypothetical protein [Winogradskyella maritima]